MLIIFYRNELVLNDKDNTDTLIVKHCVLLFLIIVYVTNITPNIP
jgi:hypothetical protein